MRGLGGGWVVYLVLGDEHVDRLDWSHLLVHHHLTCKQACITGSFRRGQQNWLLRTWLEFQLAGISDDDCRQEYVLDYLARIK